MHLTPRPAIPLGQVGQNRLQICTPFPHGILSRILRHVLVLAHILLDEALCSTSKAKLVLCSKAGQRKAKSGRCGWQEDSKTYHRVSISHCKDAQGYQLQGKQYMRSCYHIIYTCFFGPRSPDVSHMPQKTATMICIMVAGIELSQCVESTDCIRA